LTTTCVNVEDLATLRHILDDSGFEIKTTIITQLWSLRIIWFHKSVELNNIEIINNLNNKVGLFDFIKC